jgi:predicted ester cyclase
MQPEKIMDLQKNIQKQIQNTGIILLVHEKLNRGEIKDFLNDIAEDAANHGVSVGRTGYQMVLEDIYNTFPDWQFEIMDVAADGDSVVIRTKITATHLGIGRLPVNGGVLVGVKPTGKSFEVQHIHWYKLRDGKIVDHYASRDDLGMMQQIGVPLSTPPEEIYVQKGAV